MLILLFVLLVLFYFTSSKLLTRVCSPCDQFCASSVILFWMLLQHPTKNILFQAIPPPCSPGHPLFVFKIVNIFTPFFIVISNGSFSVQLETFHYFFTNLHESVQSFIYLLYKVNIASACLKKLSDLGTSSKPQFCPLLSSFRLFYF